MRMLRTKISLGHAKQNNRGGWGGGGEYFVTLLPETRSLLVFFFLIISSEVDSNGFWGVLLHPCVSKIKILRIGCGGICAKQQWRGILYSSGV